MSNSFRKYLEAVNALPYEPGVPRSRFEKVMRPGPDSSLLVVTICALSLVVVSVEAIIHDVRIRSYWRMAFWLLVIVPVTVQYLLRAWKVLLGLWKQRGQSNRQSAP